MIVQIKGNVRFPITLDPTVWIFDDRKVILEEAFTKNKTDSDDEDDQPAKTAELFNQEIYFQKKIKPPVNKSLNRYEREQALKHSYVMPLEHFIKNAEINESAERVILKTDGDDNVISKEQLESSYLLFAFNGKPLKDDGPVQLYFGDGSNQHDPIKGIKEIIID